MTTTNNHNEYLEARVLSATAAGLIEILYESALEGTVFARTLLKSGEVVQRGQTISRVSAILTELQGSLRDPGDATIPANLERLYEYCQRQLVAAHRFGDDGLLAEVQAILAQLLQGWRGAIDAQNAGRTPAGPPSVFLNDPHSTAPRLRSWTL
ncbi:MAG: flagellar export chaperone FliS [Bryobacterales bacterium]|nr:flagellar export chaperone FliS [Bryobacterales bacterium]